jgi:glucosamine--fructose-6-phosphate aminotransferase (isomerizing)
VTAFVADIRSQGEALQDVASHASEIAAIGSELKLDQFERIVFSGMGASHFATYPTWLQLVAAGLPAWRLETSELLHYAPDLLTRRTLLWLTSQSGESIEIRELLSRLPRQQRPRIVATTNDPTSSLAQAADAVIDICAGAEQAVGTRTYVNTVAALQLALAGARLAAVTDEIQATAAALDAWLGKFDAHLAATQLALNDPESLVVVARGPSLAAAQTGALTIKEASKAHAEALSVGQFRHGPIELASADITVIVLAGDDRTVTLNKGLTADLREHTRVAWVGDSPPLGIESLPTPPSIGAAGRLVSEIVPLQIASVALANERSVEPGVFKIASKITTVQ